MGTMSVLPVRRTPSLPLSLFPPRGAHATAAQAGRRAEEGPPAKYNAGKHLVMLSELWSP